MKLSFKKTALTLSAILALSPVANAAKMTQEEFNKMLLTAFDENPQLLIRGVEKVRQYQKELRKQKYFKDLYHDETTPVLNQNGEITVVEFYDLSCGVCKRGAKELEPLIGKDKRIRFVYKLVSILGPKSTEFAKIALAVHLIKPNAFPAYQKELLNMSQPTPERAYKLAELVGIDAAVLKKISKSKEVNDILNKNNKLFKDLQLTGTPTFFVGDKKFPGLVSRQALKEEVDKQYQILTNKKSLQAVSN